MNRVRIYLGGVGYEAGNIGDDGILRGMLTIIRCAAPSAEITVGTLDGNRVFGLPDDLHYVDYRDLAQVARTIRECDCLVIGGSTVITDDLSFNFPLAYNARLVAIAKLLGRKVAMLGIGANQLQHEYSRSIARTLVRLCDIITVRDSESYSVCCDLGAERQSIAVSADPAFLLSPRESPRTRQLKHHLRQKGKVFGVSVVNEAWGDLENYKACIASACNCLAASHNLTPVFICNEIRRGDFYDFHANEQTASRLTCGYELLPPEYYSPEEMIDILSVFEFVIHMRMHGLIFSAIAGTPFATISRVDKVDNLMRLFGTSPSGTVNQCDSVALVRDVSKLLQDREAWQCCLSRRVASLREQSITSIDLLRQLLEKRYTLWPRMTPASLDLVLSSSRHYRHLRALVPGAISPSKVIQRTKGSRRQNRKM